MNLEKPCLYFSHNIIEHLGLKLYQNRPVNVIAELLSNAWDANAETVRIQLPNENSSSAEILISDDGTGMSLDIIRDHYLVIGKHKRSKRDIAERSPIKGRAFMGRKGIGKLAPFGIANKVHVISRYLDHFHESRVSWFVIDLHQLLKRSDENTVFRESHRYEPEFIALDLPLTDFKSLAAVDSVVSNFLAQTNQGQSGTLIRLCDLKLKRRISASVLCEGLGRRFTVILLKDDFKVSINQNTIGADNALPTFEYRFPEKGFTTDNIASSDGALHEIRYWVGFVDIKKVDWPLDQAGVGIYAHGKIAQDRPFFFKIKGKEIFTRYMYAVIEADWIDELPEDLISTDRTSLDWEHEALEKLAIHGKTLVNKWIKQFVEADKQGKSQRLVEVLNQKNIPQISVAEQRAIADFITTLGPEISHTPLQEEAVLEAVTSAWIHRPIRQFIQTLWDSLTDSESNSERFVCLMEELNDYLIPESLSLSVTIAQRIYALSQLSRLRMLGNETQLQRLMEEYPWILSPNMSKLTADQTLGTLVKEAIDKGLSPNTKTTEQAMFHNEKLRPDLTFFSDINKNTIIIVEFKGPEISLNYSHQQQIMGYVLFCKQRYPDADVQGWLIGGSSGRAFQATDMTLTVMTWEDVYHRSRKEHIEMLAAMLKGAEAFIGDSRMIDAIQFGGDETHELLGQIAEKNPDFKSFMQELDKDIEKRKPK